MRYWPSILTLLLAVTEHISLFHVGMEANGWLQEHTHKQAQTVGHPHYPGEADPAHQPTHDSAGAHSHNHSCAESFQRGAAHDPVVAQNSAPRSPRRLLVDRPLRPGFRRSCLVRPDPPPARHFRAEAYAAKPIAELVSKLSGNLRALQLFAH